MTGMSRVFVWTGTALLLDHGRRCFSPRDIEKAWEEGLFSYPQIPYALAAGVGLEAVHHPGTRRIDDARKRMVHIALKEFCTQEPLQSVYEGVRYESERWRPSHHQHASRVSMRAKQMLKELFEEPGVESVPIRRVS